jgi:hypothetical protein
VRSHGRVVSAPRNTEINRQTLPSFQVTAQFSVVDKWSGGYQACYSRLWRLSFFGWFAKAQPVVASFPRCDSYSVRYSRNLGGARATEDGDLEGPESSFEGRSAACWVGWTVLVNRKPGVGGGLAELVKGAGAGVICVGRSQFQGQETNSLMPWHFCHRKLGILAWWGGSPKFAMACRIAREEAEVGRNRDGQGPHDDVKY